MAWTAPKTWADGSVLTAAELNTHLRDNLLETAPAKATAAGDLFQATGANAIARLALGTAGRIPYSTGSAVAWGTWPGEWEVVDPDEVTTYSLTGSFATAATASFTIPAGWASWRCSAFATYRHVGGTSSKFSTRLVIDGTAQQEHTGINQDDGLSGEGAIAGHRTGMTTTGARTVTLEAQRTVGTGGTLNQIHLFARAVRLT